MDIQLLNLLEKTGFTEKEAKVYLALLEIGQGDVSEIAKISDLKRPIIYIILEGLLKRGYVNQLPEKRVNTFQAVDPSVVLSNIKTISKHFAEMLPVFQSLKNKGNKKPRIQFIDTKEGIWKIYEDMFYVSEVFSITSYERIEKFFPGSIKDWSKKHKKGIYKTKGKHLVPDSKTERGFALQIISATSQEIKVNSKINDINLDLVIYRNKVAITSLEDEPFMILIESPDMVKSMLALFSFAWEKGVNIK